VSVGTIRLLTFHLTAFLKAGSIFESNFWNISEISGCLDVTEINSHFMENFIVEKMNHEHSS